MIKVLIVDDSALVRQSLTTIFEEEGSFEVITAPNPLIAERKRESFQPDVMVLDIEMPQMDGITYLKKLMAINPLPVVICSGLSGRGSENAFNALNFGAVDVIQKPHLGTRQFIEDSRCLIIDSIKAAVKVRVGKRENKLAVKVQPKLTADAILSLPKNSVTQRTEKIIVVGASTGGTEALHEFLKVLPAEGIPPILIVQHMPEHFTKTFADRLNSICPPRVSEAKNRDTLEPGKVLIAPGHAHMLLKRQNSSYYVEIQEGPLVCRHRPSVDVLFRSAARYAGKNAIGVIMTGMGDDGARGMLEMKQAGALTIAQNEASCVVYGMPKEAVKRNCVDHILPLDKIAPKVLELSVR